MNINNNLKRSAAALVTTLMLCASNYALAEEESNAVGVVVSVLGEVEAQGSDAGKRELSRGLDFFVNDIISTGSGATVSLRFLDGSVVDLMGLSEYKVTDYQYAEANPNDDAFSSELIKGGFRAISGKIGERNPEKVKVNAQMTTLTIRGTKWGQFMGSCNVMDLISGKAKTCNNMLFVVSSGSITITDNSTDEAVTMDAQDQLRCLMVSSGGMSKVDANCTSLAKDLIGPANYFEATNANLQGDPEVDPSTFPCGT